MRSLLLSALPAVVISVVLTAIFWWPLYGGAGFIGGDLYPYFFPQKAFYADVLKQGAFPLWNDLTGFGYPVLGESQTGAAYPFHLVTYRLFDLNTAYNMEHLLHYVLCSLGTWLLARRVGLTNSGSCLAAVVFTYGWFPPRACLEWAILTGAWLPWALWCIESFLQQRTWRYAIGLSVVLGLQLLAGHFHLAFITQLLVVTYAAWRLWFWPESPVVEFAPSPSVAHNPDDSTNEPARRDAAVGLLLAIVAGFGLAAVQLVPAWELKQRSSRVATETDYDPAYGHTPPIYLTQLIAPWCWYSPQTIEEDDIVRVVAEFAAPWHWFGPSQDPNHPDQEYDLDQVIQRKRPGTIAAGTNKVEAHCYCGLVPIGLALFALFRWLFRPSGLPTTRTPPFLMTRGFWFLAALASLLFATGWLVPIGRHLPGFSFFRGPGRYGIVATMAVSLFAGQALSSLVRGYSSWFARWLLVIPVLLSTTGDLWLVSRMVQYTVMTTPPRITYRGESDVRRILLNEPRPPRLFAPGPNVCTMLGVSCVPWYLGIAPSEYVDPRNAMPAVPKPVPGQLSGCTPELLEWLSRAGVTHVLSFERLDVASWQADPLWSGVDPFLNRVWGRSEPIHLYRFRSALTGDDKPRFPGRAFDLTGTRQVTPQDWTAVPANVRRYDVETDGPASNRTEADRIVVTELDYPGWTARSEHQSLTAVTNGIDRAVDLPAGDHELVWTYQPRSVLVGLVVSVAMVLVLATAGHLRYWHPQLTTRVVHHLAFWRKRSVGR